MVSRYFHAILMQYLSVFLFCLLVPIIPEFLYDIRHPDAPLDSYPRTPLTLHTPPPPTTPCPCKDDQTTATDYTTISPSGKYPFIILKYFNPINSNFNTENETLYRELEERHKELVGETVEVGLLFASKAFVQLLVNPIVGPLTHR